MQEKIKVLDHGFVRLVDHMGSDQRVCEAARVSYQNHEDEFDPKQDESLIRYMMSHRHTSPFEQVEFTFHIKLPIFCARQMIRHRTASVNEVSARYTKLKNEVYVPELSRINPQSSTNKQGSDLDKTLSSSIGIQLDLESSLSNSNDDYDSLINSGLTNELARTVVPLSQYTEWYWKMDLHNLFHFIGLRSDEHAQWEMQQYSNAIASIVKEIVPVSYKAFEDYVMNAERFSAIEMKALHCVAMMTDKDDALRVLRNWDGLSQREIKSLIYKIYRI